MNGMAVRLLRSKSEEESTPEDNNDSRQDEFHNGSNNSSSRNSKINNSRKVKNKSEMKLFDQQSKKRFSITSTITTPSSTASPKKWSLRRKRSSIDRHDFNNNSSVNFQYGGGTCNDVDIDDEEPPPPPTVVDREKDDASVKSSSSFTKDIMLIIQSTSLRGNSGNDNINSLVDRGGVTAAEINDNDSNNNIENTCNSDANRIIAEEVDEGEAEDGVILIKNQRNSQKRRTLSFDLRKHSVSSYSTPTPPPTLPQSVIVIGKGKGGEIFPSCDCLCHKIRANLTTSKEPKSEGEEEDDSSEPFPSVISPCNIYSINETINRIMNRANSDNNSEENDDSNALVEKSSSNPSKSNRGDNSETDMDVEGEEMSEASNNKLDIGYVQNVL